MNEQKRSKCISVLLTPDEYDRLDDYIYENRLKGVSETVRAMILSQLKEWDEGRDVSLSYPPESVT
jgi:hypothetical protein